MRAVTAASKWLAGDGCQSILFEFRDDRGLPLSAKLDELKTTAEAYLRWIVFCDGERHRACDGQGILAFTVRHSRVVHVCGRQFERASRRDARDAQSDHHSRDAPLARSG